MKSDFQDFKNFIKNKNTAVVGIGVSNTPLIHYLIKLGAKVTAFDKKTEDQLGEVGSKLNAAGATLVLGPDYMEKLSGFEVIFKTPSMRIDSPSLVTAARQGTYITSEMEEFVKYCPAKIFGITGSDGKTTTTTLVYKMLSEEGYKTWVGGNIGTPLFANIENIKPDDKVVLELSSFQLMTMKVSPEVSIVTNLTPNHLDIHKNMEEYTDAKKNIFKYQNSSDITVLNKDNSITDSFRDEINGSLRQFSVKEKVQNGGYYENDNLYIYGKEVCKKSEMQIKGMHNVENLLAAFCAVYDDVSISSMRNVAITFQGVEHRCEFVREIDGVKYYNDSIASSPTRTLAGLNAFEKPVILIAGGYDKKIPFEPLAYEGYHKIKYLILVGATKEKIRDAFEKLSIEKNVKVPYTFAENFEDAVLKARLAGKPGDIVTLSPACASFDMFPNFEARGNRFKEIVKNF